MTEKSRFIIQRTDGDATVSETVVETEGLTLGRLSGNDLWLNYRSVSRSHAGIKQIGREYWLFNLSQSNGTFVNGRMVTKIALVTGDVIQIGPYLLRVAKTKDALSILVERQLESQVVESAAPPGGEMDATAILKAPLSMLKLPFSLRGKSEGPEGAPAEDEQALEVFWNDRRREAGKVAEKTPLHPRVADQRLGKAQFNWRPNLDLLHLWRKSYFAWGAILIALFSGIALFAHEAVYSPGPLSSAHTSGKLSTRDISLKLNEGSCASCHSVTMGMQDKCIDCHKTRTFSPRIYDKHDREGIACSTCHSEHQGLAIRAGLVSYGLCSSCHNDSYTIKTGERAGMVLGEPHGGTLGYPVVNGRWEWKGLSAESWKTRGLPETLAKDVPRDQFHALHQQGRMLDKIRCTDCHTAGIRTDEGLHKSPRAECAKCHGVLGTDAGTNSVKANCNTCHQQHGRSEDTAKIIPAAGGQDGNIKKYLAALATGSDDGNRAPVIGTFRMHGGADTQRQGKLALGPGNLSNVGGVPAPVWIGLLALLPIAGLVLLAAGTVRSRSGLAAALAKVKPAAQVEAEMKGSLDFEKLKVEGPPYPHPVIDSQLCIGCHACVEACPHDVLEIVNGISTPIALDQCMEDTSCQVECPTNPKACIVINTTKVIPPRKVPARDKRLETNVAGVYMIGDVSGVPLIKNALNEGRQVIEYVVQDLQIDGRNPNADYDIAIVGVGPAGLSAAVLAKQRGLSYIAIEQDKVVSTIANYPAGKYVFFKPDTVEASGGVPLPGPGDKKEPLLEAWMSTMMSNGVQVNEDESCKEIKRSEGIFTVVTEKGRAKEKVTYSCRRIVLAIGNRGTPMKLRVPGEEIKVQIGADQCPHCEAANRTGLLKCANCGVPIPTRADGKVKYKLSDPEDFAGKRCIVVGAGNSAIETAVDLTGFKREGDSFTFTRQTEVVLVIRSDFKGDLKLGNKMNVYDCIDAGRIKAFFRTEIKQIEEGEVVLMDVRSKEEKARFQNDYVFALIGGERPTKFLESLGIKIG